MTLLPKSRSPITLVVVPAVLLASGTVTAPAPARAASSKYCSPTGDYCQGWTRKGGPVRLFLDTFSFRGRVRVCVTAPDTTVTCKRFTLRRGRHDIYSIQPRWRGSFPNAGTGTYRASFSYQGYRLGRTVSLFIRA